MYLKEIQQMKKQRNLISALDQKQIKDCQIFPASKKRLESYASEFSDFQQRHILRGRSEQEKTTNEHVQWLENSNKQLKNQIKILSRSNMQYSQKITQLEGKIYRQNRLLNDCQEQINNIRKNYNSLLHYCKQESKAYQIKNEPQNSFISNLEVESSEIKEPTEPKPQTLFDILNKKIVSDDLRQARKKQYYIQQIEQIQQNCICECKKRNQKKKDEKQNEQIKKVSKDEKNLKSQRVGNKQVHGLLRAIHF